VRDKSAPHLRKSGSREAARLRNLLGRGVLTARVRQTSTDLNERKEPIVISGVHAPLGNAGYPNARLLQTG
jgi:hypothetical protein